MDWAVAAHGLKAAIRYPGFYSGEYVYALVTDPVRRHHVNILFGVVFLVHPASLGMWLKLIAIKLS